MHIDQYILRGSDFWEIQVWSYANQILSCIRPGKVDLQFIITAHIVFKECFKKLFFIIYHMIF